MTDESGPSTTVGAFKAEDILEAVGRAVVVTDRDGVIVLWSKRAEALYGWAAGEVLGRRVFDVLVPPALTREAEEIFARVLAGEEWAGDFAAQDQAGATRWIAVVDRPVRNAAGEVVGVVGISEDVSFWRRLEAELAQSREDLRQALDRERAARTAAEAGAARLAFLAEASDVLASSLDYERTLEQVAELAVPRLSDWCGVYLTDERGGIRPVAITHADPDRVTFVRRLLDRFPVNPSDPVGIPAVMRSGRSEFYPVISEELWQGMAQNEEHLELMRSAGFGSGMIVPLRAGNRTFGAITLASDTGRRLEPEDLSLAEELASRAATAIHNARLFTERTRIARSLQSSLLPPSLPELPGLQLGARYVAAGRGTDVGGDFYDVFAVSSGCWVLALGDVCGKGVDAAAVSGLARHTIRSAAVGDPDPARILSHVNQVLLRPGAGREEETPFCTALVITANPGPAGATLVVASAGHPLPLVRRSGGEVAQVGQPGRLLGVVPQGDWPEAVVDLGPGDALVCFTDGIIERHEGSRFFDEAGVVEAVRDLEGTADDLAAAVESAAREFVDGEPVDDMAVLVLRVPSEVALVESDVA